MEESIKSIGQRLKGLREVLNIPAEEIADLCEISLEHYLKMEDGTADPSVIVWQKSRNATASTSTCCFLAKNLA